MWAMNDLPRDEISVSNRDGIPWHNAPLPRRWHKCRVWTDANALGTRVQRCACGAMKVGTWNVWHNKNLRRGKGDS